MESKCCQALGTLGDPRGVTDKDKHGNSVAFGLSQGQFHGHPATVTCSSTDDTGVIPTAELFQASLVV